MMRQLARLPKTRGLPCISFCSRTTASFAVSSYCSLTSGKLGDSVGEPPKSKYQFALPLRLADGRPVTGPADWDDYPLWVATFAARGAGRWRETDQREVPEFGLEFRSTGPESRVLRRFDEPTRSAFHNKVRLFSRLAAARVACIPTTLFTIRDTQAALSAGPPNTVWFYKKAKESRGRGVFPFTSLDQLPPEELAAAEAAEAASAAVASDASASPPASLTTIASTPDSLPAGGGGIFQREVSNMLLWEGGRKFDLRVLVVLGPGRRAWLHRTLYVRVATQPLAPPGADPLERLSRGSQCTNISQGGVVLALQGPEPGVPLSDVYDKVLDGVCTATRSVISAMYDALPAEGAIHYFGFDYMLDSSLRPWLLEANSTPRLINCNRAANGSGAVHQALVELVAGVVEPLLDGKPVGTTGGWLPVYP